MVGGGWVKGGGGGREGKGVIVKPSGVPYFLSSTVTMPAL